MTMLALRNPRTLYWDWSWQLLPFVFLQRGYLSTRYNKLEIGANPPMQQIATFAMPPSASVLNPVDLVVEVVPVSN